MVVFGPACPHPDRAAGKWPGVGVAGGTGPHYPERSPVFPKILVETSPDPGRVFATGDSLKELPLPSPMGVTGPPGRNEVPVFRVA